MEPNKSMTVDQLVTGDRPSILFFGMVGAHAIRKDNMAVFMVDVLGRVHLMPPDAIRIIAQPKISEEDLNALSEDEALQVLLKQGDTEDEIMQYLSRRPSSEKE